MDNLIKRILEGFENIIEKDSKKEFNLLIKKAYQTAIQQSANELSNEI